MTDPGPNRATPNDAARTLLARSLGWVDTSTDALGIAIQPSTVFLRDPTDLGRAGRSFRRDDNPTVQHAEALLAALEGGAGCQLFSSGMAAATAILEDLGSGDAVLVPRQLYSGLRHWLDRHGGRRGLKVASVDYADREGTEAAIAAFRPRLVWIETPANPLWSVTDIATVVAAAHRHGAMVAADNTVATPLLTRPIEFGVDVVLHSGSKYLNGHADVVAGALVFAQGQSELQARIAEIRNEFGAILGPFEAWLLMRGMRTLALRMEAICANAEAVAECLAIHPSVKEVLYPGLAAHSGHELARKQMGGRFGGMLSFRVAGGEEAAHRVAGAVRVIRRAISFGGLESTIEVRRGMEGPTSSTPPDLLRLSMGVEARRDLVDDLTQALDSLRS